MKKRFIVLALISCFLLSACGAATVTLTKDTEMPPFSAVSDTEAQCGGEPAEYYYLLCNNRLETIRGSFSDKYVSSDELNKWFEEKNANYFYEVPTDISEYANMYSFIVDFDISEQDVRESLREENEFSLSHSEWYYPVEERIYTDTEIDALSTRNKEECQRLFCSDYSIAIGDKIYPMRFWYEYSIDSYEVLGVDADVLLQHGRLYEQLLGESKQSIALSNKIMEYAINQVESGKLTGELAPLEYSDVEIPDSVGKIFSDDLQENDITDEEIR